MKAPAFALFLVISSVLGATAQDVSAIIWESRFNEMLKHRSSPNCRGGFYTYSAFLAAARSFPGFGTTGDMNTRKKELAAFFGQTSHETTGGWGTAPDGPYAWGYCFLEEQNSQGVRYHGRGPIQLSQRYNYEGAGKAIGADLVGNPDLVVTNAEISFKTAIWFWMTPQYNKPSSHDVITGKWSPNNADKAANRFPGYGMITNIINGGLECGKGPNDKVKDRIGFYKRYCDIFGIGYGGNLGCEDQKPFS